MPLLRLTLSAVSGDSGLVEYPGSNSFHPVSIALYSTHLVSIVLASIVLDSTTALASTALDFLAWVDSLMSSQP